MSNFLCKFAPANHQAPAGHTGQKMWDPLTVIQAVEGDALFSLSERDTVCLNGRGGTVFTPSATGNCRYQKPGSEVWSAAMLEKIRVTTRDIWQ